MGTTEGFFLLRSCVNLIYYGYDDTLHVCDNYSHLQCHTKCARQCFFVCFY